MGQRDAAHKEFKVMAADDLARLQATFDAVLTESSCRKQETIAKRVNQLYSKLQLGKIYPAIQAQLLDISDAISSKDRLAASKGIASISAQHWDQHREWIIGLKQLLSCQ